MDLVTGIALTYLFIGTLVAAWGTHVVSIDPDFTEHDGPPPFAYGVVLLFLWLPVFVISALHPVKSED